MGRGAAVLVKDDKVEEPEFAEKVFELLSDPQARAKMSEAAASFETQDAASRLCDVVELVGLERKNKER